MIIPALVLNLFFPVTLRLPYTVLTPPLFSFPQLVGHLFADEPHLVLFPTEFLSFLIILLVSP